MPSGTIKKLVHDKGFGFIQSPDGWDVFFPHSSVADHHFDNLSEGQSVDYPFDSGGGPKGKGPRAASVNPAERRIVAEFSRRLASKLSSLHDQRPCNCGPLILFDTLETPAPPCDPRALCPVSRVWLFPVSQRTSAVHVHSSLQHSAGHRRERASAPGARGTGARRASGGYP